MSAIGQVKSRNDIRMNTEEANTMPNDSHQRAAEFHELAAHAHRAAAVHHGKEDHQTRHEHSKQALEHADRASYNRGDNRGFLQSNKKQLFRFDVSAVKSSSLNGSMQHLAKTLF